MTKKLLAAALILVLLAFSIYALVSFSRSDTHAITVVHTVSYSNAVVFQTIREHPDRINREFIPDPAKHVETLLATESDRPAISVTPFANALIAASQNPDLRIVAGSGLNGISLIAREATRSTELKDKRIGTSRGDSLELFAVELMQRDGLDRDEYELVYFTDPFEAVEAIKTAQIDAVTHVEPFATNLVDDSGMKRVATSEELWGNHPDAVIVTTAATLENHQDELKWLIDTLKLTEQQIKDDPQRIAENLAATFYQMPSDKLHRILERQSPQIDIRAYESFLRERHEILRELKYVNGPMRDNLLDWSLLP